MKSNSLGEEFTFAGKKLGDLFIILEISFKSCELEVVSAISQFLRGPQSSRAVPPLDF